MTSTPKSHASGTSTPSSFSSFLPTSFTSSVSGLLRRLTDPEPHLLGESYGEQRHSSLTHVSSYPSTEAPLPVRRLSPFQPPPLCPLSLEGLSKSEAENVKAQLLSVALAEEIRLLIPPRLQLVESWDLRYSLERDGVSLATLYQKLENDVGKPGGWVLVIRDGSGNIFGAYLTDPPHPNPHFYGTGECFLWRSSILPKIPTLLSLPPPPSADTTSLGRSTTISNHKGVNGDTLSPPSDMGRSGASTPERIRFKAFPYSGVNDYMIFCEPGFLSVGGGDGHYGLWLDDVFEHGISSTCPTFGNEPLSEEGQKFDILGVEVWHVGHEYST